MAEYFRDEEGQDVLFFVDNIFRFTQAGSEVSALLGRIPSAVGYQPTLADRHGRSCRSASPRPTRARSPRSRPIYVPADDLTDPAPADLLRPPRRHDHAEPRDLANSASIPAVDPLDSTSRAASTRASSVRSTTTTARRVQEILQKLQGRCRTSSPFSAWTSFPKKTS